MKIIKKTSILTAWVVAVICGVITPAVAQKNLHPPKPAPVVEHYANVNGLKLYYVMAGKGSPVILLHGALSTIGKDFHAMIPELSKGHQVIGIEMQGHGHTADTDRP